MSWPFAQWQRIALQHFHIAPSEFWGLPLADWLSLISPQNASLTRSHLTQLMEEYPDD